MKNLSKIIALVLAALMIFALTSCSNSDKSKEDDTAVIVENIGSVKLGKPETALDAKKIYNEMEYTPQMFYGRYKMLDSASAAKDTATLEKYKDMMSYNDAPAGYSRKISSIPYIIEAGPATLANKITDVDEHSWMRATFKTEDGYTVNFIFAYTVEGKRLKMTALKDFAYDDEKDEVSYTLTDYTLEYEFEFKGFKLTLNRDKKSVEMYGGRDSTTDDIYLSLNNELSNGSDGIDGIQKIDLVYSSVKKDNNHILMTDKDGELEQKAVAKFEENGIVTVTVPDGDKTETHQYVYFYCYLDGLVLTDGEDVYYYNGSLL